MTIEEIIQKRDHPSTRKLLDQKVSELIGDWMEGRKESGWINEELLKLIVTRYITIQFMENVADEVQKAIDKAFKTFKPNSEQSTVYNERIADLVLKCDQELFKSSFGET